MTSPDVAIVGGGAAGSSLAVTLANAGLSVHLIERTRQFRDRIRGETIHPWGVSHLRKLGLYDLLIEHAGAQEQTSWQRYVDLEMQTPYRWSDDFPGANGLGVGHVPLQEVLLREAERVGVTIHRPAEVTFDRRLDRPVLAVDGIHGQTSLTPRMIVGADGEHSATRRWLGGSMATDPIHHMLGGVLIAGLGLAPDRIHQAFFDGGFVFSSPVGPDLARVYLVCDPLRAMAIQRAAEPAHEIVRLFMKATPPWMLSRAWSVQGPAGFFPNSTQVPNIPSSTDTVVIGDASGRNDPSQGHGLSLVFRDVASLRDLLLDGRPWSEIPDLFHAEKARDFDVLRQHARWNERTATEVGPEIDAIRERIAASRAADPTAGGFAAIFATGPSGLVADEGARRHFLGLDLDL